MNESSAVMARDDERSPWLTVPEAARRARCGIKLIYRAVHAGGLRAARLGGRHELRFLAEWIDEWVEAQTTPVLINERGRLSPFSARNGSDA